MSVNIKNIIFDFGGVFINIDYNKTRQGFIDLGIENFDAFYQQSFSNPLFSDLEKGLITPAAFYQGLREQTNTSLSDAQIEKAWSAMLGSFRETSVAALPAWKDQYQIFLFSNTNAIHQPVFLNIYQRQFGKTDFEDLFDVVYYSHNMHVRKPDVESYHYITDKHHLKLEETLFVDDTYKNIEGAQNAGLHTLWLQNDALVEAALPQYLAEL